MQLDDNAINLPVLHPFIRSLGEIDQRDPFAF